jgi:ribosomal protein S18 acetylase RimI-like enzyme
MNIAIRRLGPDDEAALTLLAREDADFDLAGRGGSVAPLSPGGARAHLANPAVLHWVAERQDVVVGFLFCQHLSLRSDSGSEVLLYEIGVRDGARRQGVGRALLDALYSWMADNEVEEVWVGADNPGAIDFYRACGFETDETSRFMARMAPSAQKVGNR